MRPQKAGMLSSPDLLEAVGTRCRPSTSSPCARRDAGKAGTLRHLEAGGNAKYALGVRRDAHRSFVPSSLQRNRDERSVHHDHRMTAPKVNCVVILLSLLPGSSITNVLKGQVAE